MRGPPPKPIEQKIREGDPGHERRKLSQPVMIGGREPLKPPRGLTAEARAFWRDTVEVLTAAGIVDAIDAAALKACAVQWGRAERAAKVIAQEGFFTRGSVGQIREHPALRIEREAHAMFLRFAEQYGLTAAARARLGLYRVQARSMQAELESQIGASPRRLRRVEGGEA